MAAVSDHQLDVDILHEILRTASADQIFSENDRFTVTRVCRLWRAVALDFPAFWRSLIIEPDTPPGRTQFCLSHSGEFPVGISIHWLSPTLTILLRHIHLLSTNITRIQSLSIVVMSQQAWNDIKGHLLAPLPSLPNLTSLSLTSRAQYYSLVLDIPLPAFPGLKELRNSGFEFTSWSWSGLEVLDIKNLHRWKALPWNDLCAILATSPRLKELCLDSVRVGMPDDEEEPYALEKGELLVLPDLWKLSVRDNSYDIVSNLLDVIWAPNLQCLTMEYMGSDLPYGEGYLEMSARPHITDLTLSIPYEDDIGHVTSIISTCQHVEKLTLCGLVDIEDEEYGEEIDVAVLDALDSCRLLQELVLTALLVNVEEMVRMMERRREL